MKRAERSKRTRIKKWKERFLKRLAATGDVGVACKYAAIGRTAAYSARKTDKTFSAGWDDAIVAYVESLEREADRRAVKGVKKPTGWYRGVAGGMLTEYSDTLLMFRLKALAPEKYRERYDVETSGKGGGPVKITAVDPVEAARQYQEIMKGKG